MVPPYSSGHFLSEEHNTVNTYDSVYRVIHKLSLINCNFKLPCFTSKQFQMESADDDEMRP